MKTNPNLDNLEVIELKPVNVNAIQSIVEYETNIAQTNYTTLGHIGMFDFEDSSVKEVCDIIKRHLGVGFIFRSHKDNYHVWSPKIYSMQELRDVKSCISQDDGDHNKIGVEKGAYALRISEKGDKPEPSFIQFCKASKYNLKDKVFSKPHLDILIQLTGSDIAYNIRSECKTVGDETRVVNYPTYQNNHKADDLANAEDVIN